MKKKMAIWPLNLAGKTLTAPERMVNIIHSIITDLSKSPRRPSECLTAVSFTFCHCLCRRSGSPVLARSSARRGGRPLARHHHHPSHPLALGIVLASTPLSISERGGRATHQMARERCAAPDALSACAHAHAYMWHACAHMFS